MEDNIRRTIGKARQAANQTASADGEVALSRLLTASGFSPSSDAFGPRAITRFVNNVERQELQWLWPGCIPLGKLTLLAGDPGLGKSLVSLNLAARVSHGATWPDTPLLSQPAGKAVLFNAEDDLADTIAPRLDLAGADDSKIIAIEGVESRNSDGGKPLRWSFGLRMQIDNLRGWAKHDRAEAATQKMIVDHDGQAEAYLNRAKGHENRAAEREATLTKTNKIVSNLEREEAAIREQMLAP